MLLAETTNYAVFTVDAVAKRADVSRATVYYQFESKTGLLEALCDALADAGQMSDLANAFMNPDPVEAMAAFITCFGRFWDVDRLVMRRLRALAAWIKTWAWSSRAGTKDDDPGWRFWCSG